jgi:acetyl-CoA carboxylase carboxyl transferase subunit beta
LPGTGRFIQHWTERDIHRSPDSVNWINNVVRPKIRSFLTTKREVPENLWVKCPESGQMVFAKDLEANQFVFPGSGYHERMTAPARLKHLFDGGQFVEVPVPAVTHDPLRFRDSRRYSDRLKDARTETELDDSVLVGEGKLEGSDVVAAAHDMRFVGGSLGMAAGEAVIAGMLRAVELNAPFILYAASGGARMQEGILSLMQMPRTTIAVQRLRQARLPYIVVLTNPTTGGVTASYAMLGDIHIAEPGALIGFAGPRVIQQTIREQLPDGFQRAEYLLAHGMIDIVVHRHKLRETLARLCRLMMRPRTRPGRKPDARINGHAALNGAAIDKQRRKPGSDGGPLEIEAEPVRDEERFDPARAGARNVAKREGPAKTPLKDDQRG